MTIEELVSWAFVNELPKGGGVDGLDNANSAWRMLQASSWGKVDAFAQLLTLIDGGTRDHGNFFIEQGEPHPDAVAVGEAVMRLPERRFELPEGWSPLEDWPLGDDTFEALKLAAVASAVERFHKRPHAQRARHLVSLVIGTAIMGRRPDITAEPPKVTMVMRGGRPAWFVRRIVTDDLGGKHEIEVDGFNKRTGRPMAGAYRRHAFADDPVGDILARLDWQLWVSALGVIAEEVAGKLTAHRLLPLGLHPAPWSARRPAQVLKAAS